MPTYVYRCKACGHQFEAIQKMTDQPLRDCPECDGQVARLLFPPGIVFKGSGFHVNDYPSSKPSASGNEKKEEAPKKDTDKEPAAASKS